MGFLTAFATGESAGRAAGAGEAAAERAGKNQALGLAGSAVEALGLAVNFKQWADQLRDAVSREAHRNAARSAVIEELQRLDPNCWLMVEENRQRIQEKVNELSRQPDVELRSRDRYKYHDNGRLEILGDNNAGSDSETGLFRDGKKIDVVGIVKGELGIE